MGCQHSITKVHIPLPKNGVSGTMKLKQSQALAKTENKQVLNRIQILKPFYVSRGSTSSNSSGGTITTLSPNLSTKKKKFRRSVPRARSRPLLPKKNSFSLASTPKSAKNNSGLPNKLLKSKSHFFKSSRNKKNEKIQDFSQKLDEEEEKKHGQAQSRLQQCPNSCKLPKIRKIISKRYSYSPQTLDFNKLPPIFKPIGLNTLKSSQ